MYVNPPRVAYRAALPPPAAMTAYPSPPVALLSAADPTGTALVASAGTQPPPGALNPSSMQAALTVSPPRLNWPVGLRVLAAAEADPWRQLIEGSLPVLTQQKAIAGTIDASLAAEVERALTGLRKLVAQDKQEARQPLAVSEEAEQFLAKLHTALRKLE